MRDEFPPTIAVTLNFVWRDFAASFGGSGEAAGEGGAAESVSVAEVAGEFVQTIEARSVKADDLDGLALGGVLVGAMLRAAA